MKDDRVGNFIAVFLLGLPILPFVLLVAAERHPTSMPPAIAAIAAAFDDLSAASSPEAIAEVVSGRAVVLGHHVRKTIGTGMWIVAERTLELKLPEGYSLLANTDVWLDGVELRSSGERKHACAGSGRHSIVPSLQSELAANRAHSLSAGSKHTVRMRSVLSLENPAGAEVWSAIHSTQHPIKVTLGVPFEQIELVTRPELAPRVQIRALRPTLRLTDDERLFPGIQISSDDPALTVSSTVEVIDSQGQVIKRTGLLLPSGQRGGTILTLAVRSLEVGKQRVIVRLSPEPRIALRLSARIMEIWGQPIERPLTIEVR